MTNYPMLLKLRDGEAVDISECPRWQDKYYDVTKVFRGMDSEVDYCDFKLQRWVWSIGRHKQTGNIYASLDTTFYQNSDFDCVWLR